MTGSGPGQMSRSTGSDSTASVTVRTDRDAGSTVRLGCAAVSIAVLADVAREHSSHKQASEPADKAAALARSGYQSETTLPTAAFMLSRSM
jgi:hypothetical protein